MVGSRGFSARALGLLISGSLLIEVPLGLIHHGQVARASNRADLRVVRTAGAVILVVDGMGSGTQASISREGNRLSIDLATK